MIIYAIVGEAPLYETTYIVVREDKALIIDPGVCAETVLSACNSLRVTPIAVLLTHGHCDHIIGAKGLQDSGIKVYAHKEEHEVINGRANLALALGRSFPSMMPDVSVNDEETLELLPFTIKVLFTPGHTQGSVCYLIGENLFSGDTLFAGSYGRTDFPTGDERDLVCSIVDGLFVLPPKTRVFSGHNGACFGAKNGSLIKAREETTIGYEYSTNPILNLL